MLQLETPGRATLSIWEAIESMLKIWRFRSTMLGWEGIKNPTSTIIGNLWLTLSILGIGISTLSIREVGESTLDTMGP